MIKEGSRWTGGDRKIFVVLHTIEQDGHTWIHYRDDTSSEPKEYSCYEESFTQRFTEVVNDSRTKTYKS